MQSSVQNVRDSEHDPQWIEKLGLAPGTRAVVIHVDDLGMCESANDGAIAAMRGVATSGSIMAPCPGFESMIPLAKQNSDLDYGVHLTLTSEFESYRWGPVAEGVPSLTRADGTFWPSVEEFIAHAKPEEVERELKAQVEKVLAAGIDISHLDSHMGACFHPLILPIYHGLAAQFDVPTMQVWPRRDLLEGLGMSEFGDTMRAVVQSWEEEGHPAFDFCRIDSLDFEVGRGLEHNQSRVSELQPGLTFLNIHAAIGNEQLQSIAPDWGLRNEEYELYRAGGAMAKFIEASGVTTLSMEPLRELYQARPR